jgi:hypothetical protein
MGQSIHYLKENNYYQLTFNLVDEDGIALPKTSIGTLFCTLYYYNPSLKTSDSYHLATINHRHNQSVKDANDFTMSDAGLVTWDITKNDTAMLDDDIDQELHIALVTWLYTGKQNSHEFYLYVEKQEYCI